MPAAAFRGTLRRTASGRCGKGNGATIEAEPLILKASRIRITPFGEGGCHVRKSLAVCSIVGLLAGHAHAQTDPAAICSEILPQAGRNVDISQNSEEYLSGIFDRYCENSGQTKSSGMNAGLSVVVNAIPIGLTLGSSDSATAMRNFCKNYASSYSGRRSNFSYRSSVVEKALDTALQCVEIARRGGYVTHRIVNDEAANVTIQVASGNKATLQGLSTTGNVKCELQGGTTPLGNSTNLDIAGNQNVTCTRTAAPPSSGSAGAGPSAETKVFDEATVTLSTSNGAYAFLWPRSVRLPNNEAADLNQWISLLEATLTRTNADLKKTSEELRAFKDALRSPVGPPSVVYAGIAAENQKDVLVRREGPRSIYYKRLLKASEGYCTLAFVSDHFFPNLGQQHIVEIRDGWWIVSVIGEAVTDSGAFTAASCWSF